MHSFLSSPTLTFDLGQQAANMGMNSQPAAMNQNLTADQMMKMMQQLQQMQQQTMNQQNMMQQPAPIMPASPFIQNPEPVHVLPPIENVQESVKSFAAADTTTPMNEPVHAHHDEAFEQDFSSAVSPVATSSTATAREMLLAKAKAFRETQNVTAAAPTATTEDTFFQPEQLSMMDDQKQVEEAKKMARDILEVPAFIRKKQGFDLTQG
jgi:cell division protein FtsZ